MYDFIINPHAKRGKGEKVAKTIEEYLKDNKVDYAFHFTRGEGDGKTLAKELTEKGATDLIAVGGDGTLHEVLNGMDPEKVNLGLIPAGSGNDFAAAAKISEKPLDALKIILETEPKPTDYMVCDGIRGINIIGTGIDVEILERCRKHKILTPKLQYVVSLIVSLIKFKFYKFRIIRESGYDEKEALIACIGNGSQFGSGIRMCPLAKIDDNSLDFVVAERLAKIRIPFAFVKLMKGKILEQDFAYMESVDHIKIEFDNNPTIQIDGELYPGLKFDVSLVKHGLRMYRG